MLNNIIRILLRIETKIFYFKNKHLSAYLNIKWNNRLKIGQNFVFGKYSEIHFNQVGKGQISIEDNISFRKYCSIYMEAGNLKIGKDVFFNNYCSINCLERIEIGENTIFGEGVKLYDHNHKNLFINGNLKIERNEFKTNPIKIGSNCWIGSNVIILKGVVIGDNVIIGANCLIYKSIPSNSIVKHVQQLVVENK